LAQRIEIDGVTFAYEDTGGEGTNVLILHGLGGSANGWLAQLEACRERGWRGIAPDQRGAGRSDRLPGPYSVDLWAQDAVRLLDALGIEHAALVERDELVGEEIIEVIRGSLARRPSLVPVEA